VNPVSVDTAGRPPSVDALARSLARDSRLPHTVLVDCARRAVADSPGDAADAAARDAAALERDLLADVINATGVLLHTNLGRAPLEGVLSGRATSLEFDLERGVRGSRQRSVGRLVALACGAQDALVVNNNAAAVLLVLAALGAGRDVAVSRGEAVEIGGGFRVPEVMEQSGVRLLDVGTTNRTRLKDYRKAVDSRRHDVALVLKVHPSNYRVEGFVEDTPVRELATLGVPVVADIGSGLLDATCPWLLGRVPRVPAWLAQEPAARQTLEDGAALVTFSGDKLLGGPQSGVIAGRTDLVRRCAEHPLARAVRPGGTTVALLQRTLLAHLGRSACDEVPFWRMLAIPAERLRERAHDAAVRAGAHVEAVALESLPGAGSAPGATIPSWGLRVRGDASRALRARPVPVVARVQDGDTLLDLRTVRPEDDALVVAALAALTPGV
jgi:L-seryl-tRNA(Ser) seleniumtransferase